MIVKDSKFTSYTGGDQETTSYRIEGNAFMADVLANKLYSRKVEAFVRELGTNAWDSHVACGKKTTAFKVKLPTKDDLFFSIRDYGTGLSIHQLKELYTVFGRSDRRDSNDFTGMMGLGSKSPFAYSELFITISYYDGQKITCTNTRTKEGFELSISEPVSTDEPNGLEVIVPIKRSDIEECHDAAQRVYRWFPIWPNITVGPVTVKEEKKKITFEGSNWEMGEHENHPDSFAIMGNVAYRLSFESITGKTRTYWYTDNLNSEEYLLLKYPLNIYFNTGELDVNAGREELSYDDSTKQCIMEKLSEILRELKTVGEAKIQNQESYWDAYKEYHCNYEWLATLIKRSNNEVITYNGKDLSKDIRLPINCLVEYVELRQYGSQYSTPLHRPSARITPPPVGCDITFMIRDIDSGAYKACGKYLRSKQTSNKQIILCEFKDEEQKKEFCEILGISDDIFEVTSDYYTRPQSVKRGTGTRITDKIFKFKPKGDSSKTSNRRMSRYWEKCEAGDSGIFVELNNYDTYTKDKAGKFDIISTINHLDSIGVPVPGIYGIKTSLVKKFDKDRNWTRFERWVSKKLKTVNKYIYQKVADYKQYRNESIAQYDLLSKMGHHINSDGLLRDFYDAIIFSKGGQKYCVAVDSLLIQFDLLDLLPKSQFDFNKMIKKLKDNYPCFATVPLFQGFYSRNHNSLLSVVETINLIDDLQQ